MLRLQHIMYIPTYCIHPSYTSLHIVYIPNVHPYILLISPLYIATFPNILYIPYVTYCTHPSCNILYTSLMYHIVHIPHVTYDIHPLCNISYTSRIYIPIYYIHPFYTSLLYWMYIMGSSLIICQHIIYIPVVGQHTVGYM